MLKYFKLFLLLLVVSAVNSWSHPHIYIQIQSKLIFEENSPNELVLVWEFDEMNSLMIIQDFDLNGDNKLSQDEIDIIKNEAFQYTANQNYYAQLVLNGKKYSYNGKISKFDAKIIGDSILRYEFSIPINSKQKDISNVEIKFFDPELLIGFSFSPKKDCNVLIGNTELSMKSDRDNTLKYTK